MVVVWLHLGAFFDEVTGEPLLMLVLHHFPDLLDHGLEGRIGEVVKHKLNLPLGFFAGLLVGDAERGRVHVDRGERRRMLLGPQDVLQTAIRQLVRGEQPRIGDTAAVTGAGKLLVVLPNHLLCLLPRFRPLQAGNLEELRAEARPLTKAAKELHESLQPKFVHGLIRVMVSDGFENHAQPDLEGQVGDQLVRYYSTKEDRRRG